MHQRYISSLPRLWLMTDERMGDALLHSVEALPKGSGVIFRHYSLNPVQRRALFQQVRKIARKRRFILLLAGSAKLARAWKADGAHGRRRGMMSAPVHSRRELIQAQRNGAHIMLASPLFETRSHVGARGLGRVRFGMLVAGAKCPVIALGGMNHRRTQSLAHFNVHGWAGIDALTLRPNDQNLKAVPT